MLKPSNPASQRCIDQPHVILQSGEPFELEEDDLVLILSRAQPKLPRWKSGQPAPYYNDTDHIVQAVLLDERFATWCGEVFPLARAVPFPQRFLLRRRWLCQRCLAATGVEEMQRFVRTFASQ